jgi:hypothetical protein
VERAYGAYFKRTYCSITPQAVAVWCRQLGHQVFYATFFDLVVKDCDKELIGDILRGAFERRSIITSGRPLKQWPTVQERMPEIETAVFVRGRPVGMSIVPLLSSIGCLYSCDFCVDYADRTVEK